MPDFPELGSGTVHGRFLAGTLDSSPTINPLADTLAPDAEPLGGSVTFTATAPLILVTSADPEPVSFFPQPLTVELDSEGYLSRNGSRDIQLWATNDPQGNPIDWQWHVHFSLTYRGRGVYRQPFNFYLPEGTIVDLTVVAPLIELDNGTIIIQGPPGESASDIITAQGDLITGDAAGDAAILPVGAAGSYLAPEPAAPYGLEWKQLPVPPEVPVATEADAGIARYATQAEVDLGAEDDATVRPSTLAPYVAARIGEIPPAPPEADATETVKGVARYATQAEVDAGLEPDSTVRPSTLAPYVAAAIGAIPPPEPGLKEYNTPAELADVHVGEVGVWHVPNVSAEFFYLVGFYPDGEFSGTGPADIVVTTTVYDNPLNSGPYATRRFVVQTFLMPAATAGPVMLMQRIGQWDDVSLSWVYALTQFQHLLIPMVAADGPEQMLISGLEYPFPWEKVAAEIGAVSDSIMLRDAGGRAKVNGPSVALDIANKGYVDAVVADAPVPPHTHPELGGTHRFLFDATPAGDPGTGRISIENVGGQNRRLRVSKTDADGDAIFLAPLAINDSVALSAAGPAPAIYARGYAATTVTDLATYWEFTAVRESGTGALPADGTPLILNVTLANGAGSSSVPWAPDLEPALVIPAGSPTYWTTAETPGLILHEGNGSIHFQELGKSYIVRHTGVDAGPVTLDAHSNNLKGARSLVGGQTALIYVGTDPVPVTNSTLLDNVTLRPVGAAVDTQTITTADGGKIFGTGAGVWNVTLVAPTGGTLSAPIVLWPLNSCALTIDTQGVGAIGPKVITGPEGPVRVDYNYNVWVIEPMGKMNADKYVAPSNTVLNLPAGTNFTGNTPDAPRIINAGGGQTLTLLLDGATFIVRHTGESPNPIGFNTGGSPNAGPNQIPPGYTARIDVISGHHHVSMMNTKEMRKEIRLGGVPFDLTAADSGTAYWGNGIDTINLPALTSTTLPAPIYIWPYQGGVITLVPVGTGVEGPLVITDVGTGPVRLDYFLNKWVVEPMQDRSAWAGVPATAASVGRAGDRAYDADFMYVCVATNTWKRAALAAW